MVLPFVPVTPTSAMWRDGSPKKAADRVASLEAALRGYRKALAGMTGNDELTRYRRTFMERSVKRTEQSLKQMRRAAS